jgi:hypothetical protein
MEKGSILEIQHKGRPYKHYAVVSDDGISCIHVNKKKSSITLDPLYKVLRNAKKVSVIDEDMETRERNYSRAMSDVGRYYPYSMVGNNCEGWVNKVRGIGTEEDSEQVNTILTQIALFSLLFL